VKLKQRIKLFFLIIFLFSLPLVAAEVSLSISPEIIYPGRLVTVMLSMNYDIKEIRGDVEGHKLYFNKLENTNRYSALWPVDLQEHLGKRSAHITTILKDGRALHYSADFDVVAKEYGRRDLNFEKEYDQKTLDRINAEKDKINAILEKKSDKQLWKSAFIKPVEGPLSGEFGRKTFIKGEERSPHAAIDIAATVGTQIKATNDGIVAFTHQDLYFEGKLILIDHGQGLYSIYVHLNKISVTKGHYVKKGDIIGEVGQTGRAAGPHLHFGMKLFNKRIDPEDVFNLITYEVPNV